MTGRRGRNELFTPGNIAKGTGRTEKERRRDEYWEIRDAKLARLVKTWAQRQADEDYNGRLQLNEIGRGGE